MRNALMSKMMMVCLVAAGGAGGIAHAHDANDSLGPTASATDVWVATCSGGTEHLTIQVQDGPPKASPKVSLQVAKDNQALNTTDPKDGDRRASPEVRLYGGDGNYTVTVNKTGAPAENYLIIYHCESAGGIHTPSTIAEIQRQ